MLPSPGHFRPLILLTIPYIQKFPYYFCLNFFAEPLPVQYYLFFLFTQFLWCYWFRIVWPRSTLTIIKSYFIPICFTSSRVCIWCYPYSRSTCRIDSCSYDVRTIYCSTSINFNFSNSTFVWLLPCYFLSNIITLIDL